MNTENQMDEKKKLALGELLNTANAVVKRVISTYDANQSYKLNLKNLRSRKAAPLEQCATFLGLTPRDEEGKKLYQNLSILTDRIILKIEALFEMKCGDCDEMYRNTLQDKPPLHCRLCLQGSHNCESMKKKYDILKPLMDAGELPDGFSWLCHECLKKNQTDNLKPPPKADAKTVNTENLPAVPEEEEEGGEEEEEEEEERESPRRGRGNENHPTRASKDRSQISKDNICQAYKRRQCPHGRKGDLLIDGKKCQGDHPPRCRRFGNFGPNEKGGCNKGQRCRFWHPRICNDSMKNRRCINEECTFFHLKGTARGVNKEKHPRAQEAAYKLPELPKLLLKRAADEPQQRLRFSSITSNYTPYPPTISSKRATAENGNMDTDPSSFLLQKLEEMKDSIVNRMEDQLSNLRASIPEIVRSMMPPPHAQPAQLPHAQPAQLPLPNPHYHPSMLPNMMLHPMMSQPQRQQFHGSSY
jgi:hypothetical protein